jgi:hypothetical protein
MKFVSEGQDQGRLLKLAFAASGPSVRTLYIEGTDTRNQNNFAVVAFPNPTVAMRESVEHLRVKNIDPFRHIYIGQEKIAPLSWMSALRHLHVMRPSHLPPHAFGLIPSSLRSVTFSDYALDSKKSSAESKTSFVASVVDCLEMTTYVKLAGVKTYGAVPDDPWELGDLSSLRLLCRKERVPFMQIGAYADIEPELMIFCESNLPSRDPLTYTRFTEQQSNDVAPFHSTYHTTLFAKTRVFRQTSRFKTSSHVYLYSLHDYILHCCGMSVLAKGNDNKPYPLYTAVYRNPNAVLSFLSPSRTCFLRRCEDLVKIGGRVKRRGT